MFSLLSLLCSYLATTSPPTAATSNPSEIQLWGPFILTVVTVQVYVQSFSYTGISLFTTKQYLSSRIITYNVTLNGRDNWHVCARYQINFSNIDSSSIINFIVTPTEKITDMFVQDTKLFPLCTCKNKHAHHLSRWGLYCLPCLENIIWLFFMLLMYCFVTILPT